MEVVRLHRRLYNGQCTIDGQRLESCHLRVRTQHICRHMVTHRKKLNTRLIARACKASAKISRCLRQVASVARAHGSHVLTFHLCLF